MVIGNVLVDNVTLAEAVVRLFPVKTLGDSTTGLKVALGSIGSVALVQDSLERARCPLD